MVSSVTIKITNKVGLHLRPAALFVQTASKFSSNIKIKNISRNTGFRNAKSSLELMTLGVSYGHEIEIEATGSDEKEAITALKELVENNFNE